MKLKIAVIGLGYVGLPLALNLSKNFQVIGYDNNIKRINDLKNNIDINNEYTKKNILGFKKINYTHLFKDIIDCNVYIITLPTPIHSNKKPNIKSLQEFNKKLAPYIKNKDLIVYESTFYPGLTRDVCIKTIEKISNKKLNKDFYVGYSPERINPGDKTNNINNVTKIISSSNKESLYLMKKIYSKVCKKLHLAESIEVAEGAKVIENIQRDINIALMNELSIGFSKLEINFNDVLKAANTKWNFLDFKPGLVGGHCIGIDPYYYLYKLKQVNFSSKLISNARIINDSYHIEIRDKLIKNYFTKKQALSKKVIILGFTFKENVNDIRNTRTYYLYKELTKYFKLVDVYDPLVDKNLVKKVYGINIVPNLNKKYDLIILSTPHDVFLENNFRLIKNLKSKKTKIFDFKNVLPTKLINN